MTGLFEQVEDLAIVGLTNPDLARSTVELSLDRSLMADELVALDVALRLVRNARSWETSRDARFVLTRLLVRLQEQAA